MSRQSGPEAPPAGGLVERTEVDRWFPLAAMAVGFAATVGSLAFAAQRAGDHWLRSFGVDPATAIEHYSVVRHVVAMLAVASFAVLVSSVLISRRHLVAAALTICGATLGPLVLVAVPLRESFIHESDGNTVLPWRLTVAAAVAATLTVSAGWLARRLPGPRHAVPYVWVVPVAVLGLAVWGGLALGQATGNEAELLLVVAWGALAAGAALVAAESTFGRSVLLCLGGVAVVGVAWGAYARLGGWPGVAGWEFGGMQPPIITVLATAPTMALAPLLGHLLGRTCAWLPTGRSSHPGER